MGLVGYVDDEIRLRSKEIAIRKVNGAETEGILLIVVERCALACHTVCSAIGTLVGACRGRAKLWVEPVLVMWCHCLSADIFMYRLVCCLLFIVGCRGDEGMVHVANENPVKSIKSE